MPQISTNEFKSGVKIEIDAQPYVIVSNDFVKPGKGQAFNRVRIKHLVTGRVIEKTFKSGDKVDVADVLETTMRLLFQDHEGATFMCDTSYEQVTIPLTNVEDVSKWFLEETLYDVVLYKGEPVTVTPPTFMELTISETAPGERGNTASGRVLKPATVETGAEIQVPIFINEGEKVKIDTRTGEYVSRVSS